MHCLYHEIFMQQLTVESCSMYLEQIVLQPLPVAAFTSCRISTAIEVKIDRSKLKATYQL